MATYAEQLVHLGKTSGVTTFSGVDVSSALNTAKVLSIISATTVPEIRRMELLDPSNAQQFVTIWGGRFIMISQPLLHQVATTAIILANATDDIGAPFPVRIPQDRFFGHVTTLMRKDHAADFNLPTGNDLVDDVLDADGVHGFDRLNFGVITAATQPVFTAVPLFLPLPKGIAIIGNPAVIDGLPPTNIACTILNVWANSLQWLHEESNPLLWTIFFLIPLALTIRPSPACPLRLVSRIVSRPFPLFTHFTG